MRIITAVLAMALVLSAPPSWAAQPGAARVRLGPGSSADRRVPSKDADIMDTHVEANTGGTASLIPSHVEARYHAIRATLIQFDFVAMLKSLGVSSSRQITDAKLCLYYTSDHADGQARDSRFEARRILMDWVEGTTSKWKDVADHGTVCGTWTKHGVKKWNAPCATARTSGVEGQSREDYDAANDTGFSVEGTGGVAFGRYGGLAISGAGMLDAARFWFDNPDLNYGWRIENKAIGPCPHLVSREGPLGYRPYLEITYDLGGAPPMDDQNVGEHAPEVNVREIEPSVDHYHCTTRQFQHKTFVHDGVWFVFYSDGKDFVYQTSDDAGKTWRRADEPVATAPNGSTSFDLLKAGDTVYVSHALYPLGRYDVNAPYVKDPARRGEYTHEGRIKKARIEGRTIRWLEDVNPGFTPDYGNLVQDTAGHFWIFTRESQQGVTHRTVRANDISQWTDQTVCMAVRSRHALDAAALDQAKLYAASVLTEHGKLYGNLYDGRAWGPEAVLISDDMTTVAGDDRRLALEFDPTQARLHLLYVDGKGALRYRFLDSPYRIEDWQPRLSEPGRELATGVFTCALSVDSSTTPYGLVITYGLEKQVGRDTRERTGELYARRFDGAQWRGEPVLVSQPGTVHNWYPNVNQDARDGLCVMYSRSVGEATSGRGLAVMVSVCRLGHVPDQRPADSTD